MLRFCVRTLINDEIRQIFKSYKHNKYKNTTVLLTKTLSAQPNLTFSHAFNKNSHIIRKIHTNSQLRVRIFKDTENTYAYSILQTIPITSPEVFKVRSPKKVISTLDDFNNLLNQNWRSTSASEIVEAFKSALGYCVQNNINISDERFDKLVDGLVDHVQDLTDSELSELLACLTEYPLCDSYAAHNFHDVWSALDDICCWKMPNWSNETRFLFAEHWYRLNLGKLSDYVFHFIDRMQKRLKFITKNEAVHLFFYLKVHKRHKLAFEYQHVLDEHISDMSLEEVAVVAMAFIPSQTKIKLPSTAECMINKLKQDLPTANEICVRRIVEVRKVGKYTTELVVKLAGKPERLTKTQLVHAFFYINICRKRFVDFNYENALEKHIHALNADEMAVVSMGFFKSQSRIKLKLLMGPMIEQTKKESRTVHEITLTAIMKVLRYSCHVLLIDQLLDLLDHLVPEIDRLSNLCCIHIVLLGTTLQFFHEKSLEKVSQKILNHIIDSTQIRLKDLERLLVALTMFDFNPKTSSDIFEAIHKELRTEERRKEFVKYRRCLPSALSLLGIRNIYSYELMDEVLDMDSIFELYGKTPKTLPRDLVLLDVCAEVECPDYKGKRLDKTYRQRATKWIVEYTPSWNQHKKLTAADKFILDVIDTVAKIVQGHRNLHADHVLPNFVKSDIIICQAENDKFVQPSGFENYTLGDVMRPLNVDLKWFAIVPVNWNNAARNTSKPLGSINMKCRQLKMIGYEPILVMWNEFLPLQEKERIEYIQSKIR